MLSLPQDRRQYLNEQMRRAGRISVIAQVQCNPQRGGDGTGFTNYGQNVATMKSEKPSLRLAASATPDRVGGLDDNARFAHVVMPHIDDAYRLAYWLTGNSTDAEDVVQDASLRAFRAIRGYAGGSARAWLLSIVRNTAYSWLRKNRPTAVVTVDDLEAVELSRANPADPDAETPESTLFARIDAEQLRAAIAALPAPFRETLVLRDIEGLDYREIAQTTEVPIGTVMSRLARGRRRLIETLGGKSHD
jgi:RNA polymerase sigma-70 factor, ECF subfamily